MTTERRVPCPTCHRPAVYGPGNPYRPFCTERCRNADLGAWANESFRLPDAGSTDPDEHGQGPARPH